MSSSVLELQQDALNPKVRGADLLRKALVLSRKLGQKEFQNWIDIELKGYTKNEDIPDYRQIVGQIKYLNPYHGWQPIFFGDTELDDHSRIQKIGQSVAELDDIIAVNKEGKVIAMAIPAALQQKLNKGTGLYAEMSFIISETQYVKIMDAVRNIVLNWALGLEEQGILGENLSFSKEEKEAATQTPQSINNFYAPVQNPQIQQGNVTATQISNNQNHCCPVKSL